MQILLLALAFTASTAHSDATTTPHLYQEMQARVRTLTRSIDTYSWSKGAKLGATPSSPLSTTDPRGKSFVQSHINTFENSQVDNTDDEIGTGLYLAADPIATMYYEGVPDWAILKLPFQSGSTYLDIRAGSTGYGGSDLSPATLQELSSLSCNVTGFYDLMKSGKCRQYFVQICDTLKIDFVTYGYLIGQFANTPNRGRAAFLLTSGKNIDWTGFRIFTTALAGTTPDPDAFDRSLINSSFVQMIPEVGFVADLPANYQTDFPVSLEPWQQLTVLSNNDWQSYIAQHFFEAGTYSEDQFRVPVITP